MICPAVIVCEVTTQVSVPDTSVSGGVGWGGGGGGSNPLVVSQSLYSKFLLRLLCGSQKESAADQQKIRQSVPTLKQNCSRRLKKMSGLLGRGDWG
jgi:hypothetical protein